MYNKPIIVFEGIDCSGKSVHTKNVVKFLQKKNYLLLALENQVEIKILRK